MMFNSFCSEWMSLWLSCKVINPQQKFLSHLRALITEMRIAADWIMFCAEWHRQEIN